MKYEILREEKNMSGKTMIWVDFGGGDVRILSMREKPTVSDIREIVDKVAKIDNEIARLQEEKNQILKRKAGQEISEP